MRPEIAQAASGWIGTPFVHQGRTKGAGVDCIGLVMGVAAEAGLGTYKFTAYGRLPNPAVLLAEVQKNLVRVNRPPEPGDVLLFRIVSDPMHFGVYIGEGKFIHSYIVRGRVVEDVLDEPWRRRLIGVYEFKGHYG